MAVTRTLLELRTGVRRKAHFEADGSFVDNDFINDLINEEMAAFWDTITALPGAHSWLIKRATLSGTGPSLSLPTDFGQVARILFSDANTRAVRQIDEHEISYAEDLSDALTFRLDYLPSAPVLSADGESISLPFGSWVRYVEYSVAARLQEEEESDNRDTLARAGRALEDFTANCTNAVRTEPKFMNRRRFNYTNRSFLVGTTQNHDYRYRLEGDSSTGATVRFMRIAWFGGA